MLVTKDHQTDEVLQASEAQLTYRYFETLENADYDLRNREPQATTQQECLVTCEVAIRRILCSLTIARDSKLHFFGNPSELPNNLQKRMCTPTRQVMANRLMGPVGIRCLERGSDQATSCNPICLAFRRINRVRLKLGLRDEKLLVLNILGCGAARGELSRNFLLGRHLFENFKASFKKKK